MDTTFSKKIVREIKQMLPELREKVKKEFAEWQGCIITSAFYSDDKLLEILPYAGRDYVILYWGIEPERVYPDTVIYAINQERINDLRIVTAHALRLLALPR